MLGLLRKLFITAVVLALLWIVVLLVAGHFGERWLERKARTELGRPLGVTVRLGGIDLGLVRGRFEVARLDVVRESLGSMRVVIDEIVVTSAPLGLAALRRDHVDELFVRGADISLSSWAVLAPPPGQERSLTIDRFELRDLEVRLAPTLLLPKAGAVTIEIDRASGGAVALRSAASWLLSLEHLDATAKLPGGTTVGARFRSAKRGGGTLTLSSDLLGRDLEIPVVLPPRSAIRVAADETEALAKLVTQVSREIAKRKAVQVWERLMQ